MSKKTDEERGDEAESACYDQEKADREAWLKEIEDKRDVEEAKVY